MKKIVVYQSNNTKKIIYIKKIGTKMKLVTMGCKSYKPFYCQTNINFAPLTIFFGKNNSGKTALLRLPRLLLRCLSTKNRNSFPLDVDDLTFGESFHDLIHKKLPYGNINLSVTLKNKANSFALDAEIQAIQDALGADYQVISKLHLKNPDFLIEWDRKKGFPPSYTGIGEIEFQGLLPKVDDPDTRDALTDWSQQAQSFEQNISHLSAHRSPISSVYERKTPRQLGLNGKGAPEWLAKHSELLDAVGDWYEKHMDGWRFSLDITADVFRCILRRGNAEVNLSNAGDGMQLLLPIIVQQLSHIYISRPDPSFLDLIEEPELHLHPAAHAPLADLFLQTAKSDQGQVVIETHSENLLLRIRRRIAEGVDPNMVALYWIEDIDDGSSSVQRIHILENGEVDYWPEGIFSETYQEVRALSRAARKRKID
jgi:predicted ATPase